MKRKAKIVHFFAAVLYSATSCGTSSGPTGNNTATPADTLTGRPSAADPAPIPVAFFGYVTDETNGAPVAGARVTWKWGPPGWNDVDIADASGLYVTTGPDTGGRVHARGDVSAPGYILMGMYIRWPGPSPVRCDFVMTRDDGGVCAPEE